MSHARSSTDHSTLQVKQRNKLNVKARTISHDVVLIHLIVFRRLRTGFDYRGETGPTGWPAISSHYGIFDIAGFPKVGTGKCYLPSVLEYLPTRYYI